MALVSCSTQDSGPYTLPGQQGRVDPECLGVRELTLSTGKPENWPHSLLISAKGKLGQCWKAHPGGEVRGAVVG